MDTPRILLDPVGDVDPPAGHRLIERETDFLRYAVGHGMGYPVDHAPLFIRGRELCEWAARYYDGRGIPTRETDSPRRAIRTAAPELTDEQADQLIAQLGREQLAALPRPLTPRRILQALYPGGPWPAEPTLAGAAAWLLWLRRERPGPVLRPLLQPIAADWAERVDTPLRRLYAVLDADAAEERLADWLGLRSDGAPGTTAAALGPFPLAVPDDLLGEAHRLWAMQIIETDGGRYDQLLVEPLPLALQQAAAAEMIAYLQQNPSRLTLARYDALLPHCAPAERDALSRLLRPELPPEPPTGAAATPEAMLDWFERRYLPYRVWQSRHGTADDADQSDGRARRFADWYLRRYPSALLGGELQPHLSFRRMLDHDRHSAAAISNTAEPSAATLVIVLDGLHAHDADRLRGIIETEAPRLALLERSWVFAPLPTVTRFAKDALLKGLDPRNAADAPALSGGILPERISPAPRLATAAPGDWFIWRVMEPDDTYHGYNSYDKLDHEVGAALRTIAGTIAEIVDQVPEAVGLRIILTSDHGRLLARATRAIDVPDGMESHGRAAWGSLRHAFDESGVVIEGDLAFLHGERFGLPAGVGEAAVAIGPQMFMTNDRKGGREAYPHGGAYPEEVIVPWWVMERDWQPPTVGLTLTGTDQAGRAAVATLDTINPADISLRLAEIILTPATGDARTIALDATLRPRAKDSLTVTLAPWPTQAEIDGLSGRAIFRMPTGRAFEAPITLALQSRELYRRDTLLEDMDL